MNLQSKTILITGGTSKLGEAYVKQALAGGATIFFTYHANEAKARELETLGATGFRCDLTDMRAIDELVAKLREKTKILDVLIHNAALVRDHTLKNLTEEDWDLVLTADLKAPYYLTKHMLRLLFKSERGKIFFVTSRVGVQGAVGVANYAAAKAGLIGMMKSLAQELGRKKILVNAINPGFMQSAMTRDMPADVIQKNLDASPLGEWSNPEEVARHLVYLSSPAMTQITGQVLHLESRHIDH